jgi:hypothetical protein
VSREEYLSEAHSDGDDDQYLSTNGGDRLQKWQKGLAKAEPPRENTTTYK